MTKAERIEQVRIAFEEGRIFIPKCEHMGALDVHEDGRHTCEDCGARIEFVEEFASAAEAIAGKHAQRVE